MTNKKERFYNINIAVDSIIKSGFRNNIFDESLLDTINLTTKNKIKYLQKEQYKHVKYLQQYPEILEIVKDYKILTKKILTNYITSKERAHLYLLDKPSGEHTEKEFKKVQFNQEELEWGIFHWNMIKLYKEKIDEIEKGILNDKLPKKTSFNGSLQATHNELLKKWIEPRFYDKYIDIEIDLLDRGFLTEDYKWNSSKIKLIDFIVTINQMDFLLKVVRGKRMQLFHRRRFISNLYGLGERGLSESAKKHKPSYVAASIPFSWINYHLNRK